MYYATQTLLHIPTKQLARLIRYGDTSFCHGAPDGKPVASLADGALLHNDQWHALTHITDDSGNIHAGTCRGKRPDKNLKKFIPATLRRLACESQS